MRMWLGPKLVIMLANPIDIETVLTSPHCLSKDEAYKFLKEGLATEGLVTSEGTFSGFSFEIQINLKYYIAYLYL